MGRFWLGCKIPKKSKMRICWNRNVRQLLHADCGEGGGCGMLINSAGGGWGGGGGGWGGGGCEVGMLINSAGEASRHWSIPAWRRRQTVWRKSLRQRLIGEDKRRRRLSDRTPPTNHWQPAQLIYEAWSLLSAADSNLRPTLILLKNCYQLLFATPWLIGIHTNTQIWKDRDAGTT